MQDTLKIIFSLAWKDWLLFIRQPFLILISIVMPVVFVLFYAMIIPVSATTPVVIALEGEGHIHNVFSKSSQKFTHKKRPIMRL